MFDNVKIAEKLAILATLDPASVSSGTVVTSWVPATNFMGFIALLQTGVMGSLGTIDAKLQQATSAAGAGAKDITGKAITQIVAASGNNKQALIECRTSDLDGSNGFNFVALSVTVGTASSIVGASLIGGNPVYSPTAIYNQPAVVQVV